MLKQAPDALEENIYLPVPAPCRAHIKKAALHGAAFISSLMIFPYNGFDSTVTSIP